MTILPYNRVGAIAARWLADLGRAHAAEAKAVEVALDSLGFDTELTSDPELPAFILIVVRNPFRASAHTMGFMFWFRGDRIQEQGVELKGGREPRMRAWWNGNPNAPYEWVVIAKSRTRAGPTEFFLFRLTSDGGFWRVGQYPGNGPDFGDACVGDLRRPDCRAEEIRLPPPWLNQQGVHVRTDEGDDKTREASPRPEIRHLPA